MKIIKNIEKVQCHDCKKETAEGVRLMYDNQGKKIEVFKCSQCFEKNKALKNYQPCEVYSRVVGYLRPVQQWNLGKQKEFDQRKEYKV